MGRAGGGLVCFNTPTGASADRQPNANEAIETNTEEGVKDRKIPLGYRDCVIGPNGNMLFCLRASFNAWLCHSGFPLLL